MAKEKRAAAEALWLETSFDIAGKVDSSKGTAWEDYLDQLTQVIEEQEELVHVCGFLDSSRKFYPAVMLTVTSKRIIYQSGPALSVGDLAKHAFKKIAGQDWTTFIPLDNYSGAKVKRYFWGLSYKLLVETTLGKHYEWDLSRAQAIGIIKAIDTAFKQFASLHLQ